MAAAIAAGIVAALHLGKVPPAMSVIRAELGLDLVHGGFVMSAFSLLGMTLAVVVGVSADRLGRRRLIVAGFLALIIGGGGGALAQGFPLLLLSRFIEGMGFFALAVSLPAVVLAASSPRDRPLALSLWSIFTPAGMALAMAGAPPLLAVVGWRGAWAGGALLAVIMLLVVRRVLAGVALPPPPAANPLRMAAETVIRPGLLLLATAFGAYTFQWVSMMVWLPTFLAEDMGASGAMAALLSSLVVLVNVPGNITSGWLQRQGVPPRLLVPGGALIMALASWGLFSPALGEVARFGLCLVFSYAGGFIPSCMFAQAPAHAPSPGHMGAANGMLMQGAAVGQVIGPPAIAAAVAAAGGAWSGALLPLALAAGVAAVGGVWAVRYQK